MAVKHAAPMDSLNDHVLTNFGESRIYIYLFQNRIIKYMYCRLYQQT